MERREHARKQGGEEECTCSFILSWLHGPNAGNLTATAIENICQVTQVQSSVPVDPNLASFLKVARERVTREGFIINREPGLIPKADGDSSSNIKRKQSFIERLNQAGYFVYEALDFCVR